MRLEKSVYVNEYSHVYVEKEIAAHENTKKILRKLPHAKVIYINRYQELFHRPRQDYYAQHKVKSLILAKQTGTLLYPGSKVCQDFDERFFMYCSSVMNCPYDCDYCWLKGMYDSGMIVIFVNIEDIFQEVEKILEEHPLYLCVSYDTDLLGLNYLTGYVEKWCTFCVNHPNLTIEIRSKGGKIPEGLQVNERCIFAITMTPNNTISISEKGSPKLDSRIQLALSCLKRNIPVRICLDPILVYQGWQKDYLELIEKLEKEIGFQNVRDVSIGTFRLSNSYFKKIRKMNTESIVLSYPYVASDGYYHLPDEIEKNVNKVIKEKLCKYMDESKIFEWREV